MVKFQNILKTAYITFKLTLEHLGLSTMVKSPVTITEAVHTTPSVTPWQSKTSKKLGSCKVVNNEERKTSDDLKKWYVGCFTTRKDLLRK